jgi:hypothetical protein
LLSALDNFMPSTREKNRMTARGEMSLEQLSGDTLKVILSGQWKLEGELPGTDKVQQTLKDRPGVRNLVFDTGQLATGIVGIY